MRELATIPNASADLLMVSPFFLCFGQSFQSPKQHVPIDLNYLTEKPVQAEQNSSKPLEADGGRLKKSKNSIGWVTDIIGLPHKCRKAHLGFNLLRYPLFAKHRFAEVTFQNQKVQKVLEIESV